MEEELYLYLRYSHLTVVLFTPDKAKGFVFWKYGGLEGTLSWSSLGLPEVLGGNGTNSQGTTHQNFKEKSGL